MIRLPITTLVLALCCAGVFASNDILIADFEGKDYGDWIVEGNAFGSGPARGGTLPNQMKVAGYEGEGLVNSFYGGDGSTGTLTSPEFTIQRRYINFLIGGGKYPGQTCIDLLVDNNIARTATGPNDKPGGSENLEWHSWDVSDLSGKKAAIRIVDNQTGGWGHINVDHIIQSDTKFNVELADFQRPIEIEKRYLHFPVKHNGKKRLLKTLAGGKSVREFEIELATGKPDYWVFLDVSEFQGQTITLQTAHFRSDPKNLLEVVTQGDKIKNESFVYLEKLRPQFHFSSKRGWNNDPNGLIYYKGEYHLFYQHNPYGWAWGNMTWGHAVSTDLVNWTELGDAIHPGELGTIFSGSAVIDTNNTAGFKTGNEDPLVCFYTSAGGTNPMSEGQPFTQSLAYSNDRGRTFTKYAGNPIIKHINGGNRDPKVIWHEPTNQWAMVLYLDENEMGFFTSNNLKEWEYHSKIKCFHECPELFELPVDGDPDNTKWILYGGSGDYLIGDFNGTEFKPETNEIRFQYGNCFYASQTFNNIPEEDGRRIQIAWGRVDTEGMPFNQMMLFPVTLTLHDTDEGLRLFANPVREIEKLYLKETVTENTIIAAGESALPDRSSESLDIDAVFEISEAKTFGFKIRGQSLTYDTAKQQLTFGDLSATLKPMDDKIHLRLLIDRTTVEIFANQGRVYMPARALPADDEQQPIKTISIDKPVKVEYMKVRTLESIWR